MSINELFKKITDDNARETIAILRGLLLSVFAMAALVACVVLLRFMEWVVNL